MYNSFQLAKKYLRYYFTSANGKGHGVHSPFVFDFITNVLNDKKNHACYPLIEQLRKDLLQNNEEISVTDFGAGSTSLKTNKRIIKKMAASSLKPKKYAQLIFRIVNYYQPKTILELGTSFGITTSYLAGGNKQAQVFTCEGSPAIASIAKQNFEKLGLNNIELIEGDFTGTLPVLLSGLNNIDLAFIDGNHRREPTLEYFRQLLGVSGNTSIFIFDDIHWSSEMEAAWEEIKAHPAVTQTIDLFFIGIVLFNSNFVAKQHYSIRF